MTAQEKLVDSLQQFIESAENGVRIPTVRELMKTYGVGQATVQDALRDLKSRGLVQSHVGRGSFVAKADAKGAGQGVNSALLKSVLILSNVNMNARCTMVQSLVVKDIQARGAKVVQMSYSDTEQLLAILKGIPSFDAVIMQSHYETIPISLLSALNRKTCALVLDGLTVTGVDIDRVGVDWLEVAGLGLQHLIDAGCSKPALITIDSSAQPIVLTRRFFDRLRYWGGEKVSTSVHILEGIVYPTQNPEAALTRILDTVKTNGSDSVIFLGMSETVGIDAALTSKEPGGPKGLPAVVLGHTDVQSEHLDKYSIAGVSHIEAAQCLVESIVQRLKSPNAQPQTHYLKAKLDIRQSSAQ